MRRLTEIRDVVTNLVSSETARGSLEEEVAKSVATASGTNPAPAAARTASPEGRRAAATQMPGRAGARDSTAARSAADREQRSTPTAALPGQHAASTEERSPATAKATRSAPDSSGSRAAGESTRHSTD